MLKVLVFLLLEDHLLVRLVKSFPLRHDGALHVRNLMSLLLHVSLNDALLLQLQTYCLFCIADPLPMLFHSDFLLLDVLLQLDNFLPHAVVLSLQLIHFHTFNFQLLYLYLLLVAVLFKSLPILHVLVQIPEQLVRLVLFLVQGLQELFVVLFELVCHSRLLLSDLGVTTVLRELAISLLDFPLKSADDVLISLPLNF